MSTISLQKTNYMEKARPVLREIGKLLKETLAVAAIDVLTHPRPGEGVKGKALRIAIQVGKNVLGNASQRIQKSLSEKEMRVCQARTPLAINA